jgi:hypothetical protein
LLHGIIKINAFTTGVSEASLLRESKLLLRLFFRRLQLTTVDLADFRAGGMRSESFFQVAGAEVIDRLIANFYYPGLGFWRSIFLLVSKAIEEFLGGGHGVIGYFKVAGFDVDQDFLLFL